MYCGFLLFINLLMTTMGMTFLIIRILWMILEQCQILTECCRKHISEVWKSWWILLWIIHQMNIHGLWKAENPKIIHTGIIIFGKTLWMERNQITGERALEALSGNLTNIQECITCICSQRNSLILIGKMRRFVIKYMIWWTGGAKKESTDSVWTLSACFRKYRHFQTGSAKAVCTETVTLTSAVDQEYMNFSEKWIRKYCQNTIWLL